MRGEYKDHPKGQLTLASLKRHVITFSDMLMNKKTRQPTLYGWIFLIMLCFILLNFLWSRPATSEEERSDRPDVGRFANPFDQEFQVERELDPQEKEFKRVMEHNLHGEGPIELPEFDPNKHKDMHEHDPVKAHHMKHYGQPSPKEFPVGLVQQPTLTCPENKIQLLILVNSRPDGTGERSAIRRTWGVQTEASFPSIQGLRWRTIFVMGMTETRFDAEAAHEAKEYGDILQGQFKDSPFEQTRKIMLGMKWLNEHMEVCIPEFVLVTNENIYHNMPTITEWLEARFKGETGVFVGKLLRRDRPIRNPSDPLYVSADDYRDEVFPNIIQGPEFLMSSDVFVRLNDARPNVVPIAMEDAYLGLLAKEAGVVPKHNDHFQMLLRPSNVCHTLKMFFVYKVLPYEHMEIFKRIKHALRNNDCPGADMIDLKNNQMEHREINV